MAERTWEPINNSFVFYQSFLEAIEMLPTAEDKLKAYQFITRYGINWEIPEWDNSMAYMIFIMAKPNIDVNNKKKENWKKWWAPEWNQNATKSRSELENQPKTTNGWIENNQWSEKKTSNEDINEDVDVNVDVNEKRVGRGEFKKCFLSDAEYQKVIDDYWTKNWELLIWRVDNYCASKWKKYKNYVAAIRKFAEKDGIPKLKPKPTWNETWIYENARENDVYLQSLIKWNS